MSEFLAANRARWDERAPAHAQSPDYAVERLIDDPHFLSDVVRFDLPRLGADLSGITGVHLQCHIGTDTISLSRLGATMLGLDFSPASIEQARDISVRAGAAIDYRVADVYDAVEEFGRESFDLVYTGMGALCWLPDIARWAAVVAGLLRPGGRLFLREGHPLVWALDDERTDGQLALRYDYFEETEPLTFHEDATYVATTQVFTQTVGHNWNHGLGETVQALLEVGLVITGLAEHDSVPWLALPGMAPDELGEYRLPGGLRVPCSYTLQARRPRS